MGFIKAHSIGETVYYLVEMSSAKKKISFFDFFLHQPIGTFILFHFLLANIYLRISCGTDVT